MELAIQGNAPASDVVRSIEEAAAGANPNERLESFCDGVFAFALTLLIVDIEVPQKESIGDAAALWHALGQLAPSVFAFLLSFGVILITWVNHHSALKLVGTASASFIYANGLLLLTVVLIPFTAALLGAFLLTDRAAPAVVLYDAVLAIQALSWILVAGTAVRDDLTLSERAKATMRENGRHGYFAVALYFLFALTAFWFPLAMALVTTLSWSFWLVLSIRMKTA